MNATTECFDVLFQRERAFQIAAQRTFCSSPTRSTSYREKSSATRPRRCCLSWSGIICSPPERRRRLGSLAVGLPPSLRETQSHLPLITTGWTIATCYCNSQQFILVKFSQSLKLRIICILYLQRFNYSADCVKNNSAHTAFCN